MQKAAEFNRMISVTLEKVQHRAANVTELQ